MMVFDPLRATLRARANVSFVDPFGTISNMNGPSYPTFCTARSAPAQSMVPSNGSEMVVGPPAVVVHVRGDEMLGHGLHASMTSPSRCGGGVGGGVADVQADADAVESSSMKWTIDPARDNSFGMSSSAIFTPSGSAMPDEFLDAVPCGGPRVAVRSPLRARHTEMRRRARASESAGRCAAPARIRRRCTRERRDPRSQRERAAPASSGIAVRGRRVNASQLHAGFGEPLLQVRDRRRVVVVEMRAGRIHLDPLESVRRDLQEMLAAQALPVIEVRGDPELPFGHKPNCLCYSSGLPVCLQQIPCECGGWTSTGVAYASSST